MLYLCVVFKIVIFIIYVINIMEPVTWLEVVKAQEHMHNATEKEEDEENDD